MAADKMTPKQEMFCKEYLIDLNATQAAIRAGYSPKTAYSIGHELLKKVEIAYAIEKGNKERQEKVELTAAWVLNSLIDVANKCREPEPVVKFNYITKEMEETGEYRFDSIGANKSLELLGKHLKLFTDKTEITGSVGVIIEDDIKNKT